MMDVLPIPPFLVDFEPMWADPETRGYFEAALTRQAYLQEGGAAGHHHEALEWLGDRVLEAVVAAELWRRFPFRDPGLLDAGREILCGRPLMTEIAEEIELLRYIRGGIGEVRQGQIEAGKALSDHVEALIGAAFLADGMRGVEAFVHRWWAPHWFESLEDIPVNASSVFNQLYTGIWRTSPTRDGWAFEARAHGFICTVTLPDGQSFTGSVESTKKDAKASACAQA
ncbi:MAG: hypothetical protein KC656_30255, partial [Myxococcales bacterium]|nr:hypothetical protein [Myxococcales bacterium]